MADDASLISLIRFAPTPFNRAAGARTLEALAPPAAARALVLGVAGCSPYLARLMERYPAILAAALAASPEESLARASAAALGAADEADPAAQMKALRVAKADAALSFALAEISGARSTMEAARLLSRFADAAINAALRMALRAAGRLGFAPIDDARPEVGSGVTVLAMGKLGAFELNYSSDIDLVVLFDSASAPLGGPPEAKRIAVAVARTMVARLNDQTADGYVFRTDLRLRPDPGVSAAAVSVSAAETYYESYGQNWERAAFIKARAAAGDIPLGEAFIGSLRPFIWRKFLDFAAIEEIHAVMRQIHEGQGAAAPEFHGVDLKRGRGGIREIEFFAQAQQLIGGGKNQALRARATLDALAALSECAIIEARTCDALSSHYRYLRMVEHRLQMIADEQTHRIPPAPEDAARLAAFLGEADLAAFERRLVGTFRETHRLTAPLFRPEEGASDAVGDLIFTGVDNDPATIEILRGLGFERPEHVADAFRRWQAGETRATRSARARGLLAKATPQLIRALARAASPDEAFNAFDGFLRGLPAGVQIFSLFINRPDVFERLVRIMTVSPYLAREVSRRAYLAEALIESRWPDEAPTRAALDRKLAVRLAAADAYEEAINAVRRWASEENFSVSAQLIVDLITPEDAAGRFTRIAETALGALLDRVIAETERLQGPMPGEIAVVALGRLGARQLTAASDVDLMFIYDAPEAAGGGAAIDPVTYHSRLVRRYLSAVTMPTGEGALYDVDMKLRPSGSKGPAAVRLSAFHHYYATSAWTFEAMALTRARVIAGGPALARRVEDEIAAIIARPRDSAATAREVDDMRERLKGAKPAVSPWDLKVAIGGFVEIDFTIQYLLLTHSAVKPDDGDMIGTFERANALTANEAQVLRHASRIFDAIHQLSRAAAGGVFAPGAAGADMRRSMSAILGAGSIMDAEAALVALEKSVRDVYEAVVVRSKGEAS